MQKLFEQHIQHLQKETRSILERTQFDGLLIHSGDLQYYFLDDYSIPFKVNPHFNYWCPLTQNPNCFIFIQPGKKPVLFYFKVEDFWHKMPEDPHGFWVDSFDIKMVTKIEDVKNSIGPQLCELALITSTPDKFNDWKVKSINPQNIIHEFHFIRGSKTNYEQACLEKANEIASVAHKKCLEAFKQGLSEYEIFLEYARAVKQKPEEQPYQAIVALNDSAAILHYHVYKHERPEKNIYSFLLDAGAQYHGYASDITRTYAFENNEFHDLILALDEEQKKMPQHVKVGQPFSTVHIQSHFAIARILKNFGLVNLPEEAQIEKGITRKFYPHGLGHLLGIQVHDVGGNQQDREGNIAPPMEGYLTLRSNRIVEENFVVTIEPGLYFIDSLLKELKSSEHASHVNWSKVDSLRKYGGIRIEDDIVVKKDGNHINLTRKFLP